MKDFLMNLASALSMVILAVEGQDERSPEEGTESVEVWKIKQHLHSFYKPYLNERMKIPYWGIKGDTQVTDSQIRLTPNEVNNKGYLINNRPSFNANWEAEFEFKVGQPSKKSNSGDGFAFWYIKEFQTNGPVFGLPQSWEGLAVIFDTFTNASPSQAKHGSPYVSAYVYDGTQSYNHGTDGFDTQIGGCRANFRNRDYPTKARISYLESSLKVELDYRGFDEYVTCFEVRDVTLPTGYFYGFSAVTGGLTDIHDIISLDVSRLKIKADDTKPRNNQEETKKKEQLFASKKPKAKKGGNKKKRGNNGKTWDNFRSPIMNNKKKSVAWKIGSFFFYLAIIIVIAFGALVGYRYHLNQRNLKRF